MCSYNHCICKIIERWQCLNIYIWRCYHFRVLQILLHQTKHTGGYDLPIKLISVKVDFYCVHIMHHCFHSTLILTHLNHLASRCYSNSLKDTFQPADNNCQTQPDSDGPAQLALSHRVKNGVSIKFLLPSTEHRVQTAYLQT